MLPWDHLATRGSRRLLGVGALLLALLLLAVLLPATAFAGGTPDPGTSPLQVDSGDADTLPDNENQLLGFLGPDRGFGFGDYVNDNIDGLQSTLGAGATFDYYVEVPPGQTSLVLEIFDADVGAGEVAGTELHDQANNVASGWDMQSRYELVAPDGTSFSSIVLAAQDCDPITAGLQTGCDNSWSDLGVFTVTNPDPGHWRFRISSPNTGITDEDDNNSFGIRAHDGDATAGGTEFAVYADTYAGIGQVYSPTNGPSGLSRTHDFFPWIANGCSFDSNDWDTDANGDESITLTPPRPPIGTPALINVAATSSNAQWAQDVITGWTTDQDATNYGLWSLRWLIGEFNFITYWMGDESAANPSNAVPGPGNGVEPNQQPEAGAIRLYLPADGSRFFGERGGADDVVLAPQKPWVGQSWALLAGEPPLQVGSTSRVRVTITVANPTALPIQFGATTADAEVVAARVPTNLGQVAYVTGSATINNSSGAASAATSETPGGGFTDLVFAPGVVDPGVTATLTYDIDVTPTSLGTLVFTGSGTNGTRGNFLDGACADAGGGPSACAAAALPRATSSIGPLCPLAADIASAPAIGLAKRLSNLFDNGDGTFRLTFTFVIENLGNVTLDPVTVSEPLDFGPTATFFVTALNANVTSGTGVLDPDPVYDGGGLSTSLLDSNSFLDPGATGEIVLGITFDPNQETGPFVNQAIAIGTTPGGGNTTDPSDDGAEPDTDGDGMANEDAGPGTCPSTVPGDQCENDPTVFGIPDNPVVGIAKDRVSLIDNGDGTFTVTFDLLIDNLGNVDLVNLQVTDSLASAITAPATYVIDSATATGPAGSGIVANPAYDGDSVTTLIDGGLLGPGESATAQLVVTFDPQDRPSCQFSNSARAGAASPQSGGAEATFDLSDFGTVTDPDGDGNPNEDNGPPFCSSTNPVDQCENDPTTFFAPVDPVIGFAKRLVSQTTQPGGSYLVEFEIVVENLGNVHLNTVDVTDNLSGAFPAPATFTIVSGPTATGTLVVNPGYDGVGDVQLLLAGSSTLEPFSQETVSLQVEFENNGLPGPFFNQANGTADSCNGMSTDSSDNGTDPDPDGDGDPNENAGPPCPSMDPTAQCENDPTPITIDLGGPDLAVEKALVDVVDEGDGTFTATFLITLENTGGTDLEQVSAIDDLGSTFPAPASVLGVSIVVAPAPLSSNPGYDGTVDTELLVPATSSLPFGATGTITYDVTFDPAGETEFLNTVDVSATSPQGEPVQATGTATVTVMGDEPPVLEIPTLGGWGLAALAALLGLVGVGRMRRR